MEEIKPSVGTRFSLGVENKWGRESYCMMSNLSHVMITFAIFAGKSVRPSSFDLIQELVEISCGLKLKIVAEIRIKT